MNFLPRLYLLPKNLENSIYHLDMVYSDDISSKIPVIAFTKLDENKVVNDIEEIDLRGSELVRNAFKNLKSLSLRWSRFKNEGVEYLFVDNNDFAAEKILDKSFLKEAEELLSTKELLICIPCRGAIFCCAATDLESRSLLEEKVDENFNDFSKHPVSNHLYLIEEGIIKKVLMVQSSHKSRKIKVEQSDTFSFSVVKMTLFQELFTIKVMVEADSMKSLTNELFKVIYNVLIEYGSEKGFNGSISIQSAENKPVKNGTNVKLLKEFYDRLQANGKIKSLSLAMSEKLKLSFQFGVDFNKGDSNNKYTTIF